MRVLAASFIDAASARAARVGLFAALHADRIDVDVASLARPHGAPGDPAILAGRFADHVVEVVKSVVERFGGTVVADVDDARTHS
jgi:predicted SpoU family rRNA methylase